MALRTDDVKNKILETSRTLFSRFGLEKTTVDEIAGALHMGKSSLYYYYKNKEDIFTAVVQKELSIFIEQLRASVRNAPTPLEKIKIFGTQRMKYLRELSNINSAVKDAYLHHYSFVREMKKDYELREIELMKEILQEGVNNGDFSLEDTEQASRMMLTALKGFEYEWTIENQNIDIDKNVGKMLNALYHGIAKR